MSKKNRQPTKSIATQHTGKLLLAVVALGVAVVLGGKYLIQNKAAERLVIVVPPLSPEGKSGQVAFQTHCAACHGENAGGTEKGPPLVSDIYRPAHHGDYSFVRAVTLGVPQHHWFFGNMQPLPQVSRTEIDQIVIYIRELQRANGIQ